MMGYNNGCVATILINKKPIREFQKQGRRTVTIPFGSEYTIRLKNNNSHPVLASISIDGTDIINGDQLFINSKSTVDIERFIDDFETGKKLKFISIEEGISSGKIDDPYRAENGLITVEFFEAFPLEYTIANRGITSVSNSFVFDTTNIHDTTLTSTTGNFTDFATTSYFVNNQESCKNSSPLRSCSLSKKGATVEGTSSNQKFHNINGYYCGSKIATIVILMEGKETFNKNRSWGVFVQGTDKPIAQFEEHLHACEFIKCDMFKNQTIHIKQI